MHSPAEMRSHLEHRSSILSAFISERKQVSRAGFNCYFDATVITCRSLWGLLGITMSSRKETDLKKPTATNLSFSEFANIRKNISPLVQVTPFSSTAEFEALPEKDAIFKVLAAANKCVAHFEDLLHHGVDENELELVAKRTLHELSQRVKIPV
jgi:hypothetical protein